MRQIVKWCLDRSAVVVLLTVVVLAAGIYGTTRLRQQFFPDVDFPIVIATIPVEGLDAQSVDEQVARPLARAAESVAGAGRTVSVAQEGTARVVIELDYGIDTDTARDDILEAMNEVDLPEDAGDITIEGGFNDQAVVVASLTSDDDLNSLTRQATDLKRDLENIDGVSKVEISGQAAPQYLVELRPEAVAQGANPQALASIVHDAVAAQTAGVVVEQGARVPLVVQGTGVSGEADLRNIEIGAGRKLGDVATISRVDNPAGGFAITNGKPSVSVSVYRQDHANEVEVVDTSMERLDKAEQALGKGNVTIIYETASEVKNSIRGLLLEAGLGALLAVIVIFLFLRSIRGTLVAAIAIPTSLVFGVFVAWQLGLTLNIITLAGLTIAIGRVIDDAIVVIENIHKHLARREPRVQAVVNGTSEVANAIASSTLATAAVFIPLGVVGGLISELFVSFSIIVTAALLASFVVAITVVPVLSGLLLRNADAIGRDGATLARMVTPATRFGIRHRWIAVGAAVATFAATLAVVAAGAVPVQFLPETGTQQVFGFVALPPGTEPDQARPALKPLQQQIEKLDGVKEYQIAFGEAGFLGDLRQTADSAPFFLTLTDDVDAQEVVNTLRTAGEKDYPGRFTVRQIEKGPPAGSFQATVTGPSQEQVASAAGKIVGLLRERKDAVEIQNDAAQSTPQLVVKLNPEVAGEVSTSTIIGGIAGLAMPADGGVASDGLPIVVQVDPTVAGDVNLIRSLPIASPQQAAGGAGPQAAPLTTPARPLTIGDVATIERVSQPAYISRVEGKRAATVTASLQGDDTNKALRELRADIADLDLDKATVSYEGEASFIADMFRDVGLAMVTAIIAVYFVLVLFFGSTTHPLTILTPILFSTIGSMMALAVSRQAVGLPAMIGQLLLIGIVVANSILLVDTALRLKRAGVERDEALMEAARLRVRPVLMTAAATIMALLPLALGISGEGGIISRSLGTVVIGGLLSATLLTLVIVPAVFTLFDRGRASGKPSSGKDDDADRDDASPRPTNGKVTTR